METKDFKFQSIPRKNTPSEVPFYGREQMDSLYLKNKRMFVHHTLIGTVAATAANYGTFWIAPAKCTVVAVQEVHQTAGSDAGAVTLTVEKLTGTTAPGSGVSILASTVNLKGTANTVVEPGLTTTIANKNLAKGDRLALVDTGTLTAVDTVAVVITLRHDF